MVLSAIIIAVLWRKTRRLKREADFGATQRHPESQYQLYGKEGAFAGEDDPNHLRQQLADVRRELTAMSVLSPSTIRDQSDYVRDLALVNDGIRQVAMRANSKRRDLPAGAIKAGLCSALSEHVFSKFDAGLDERLEHDLNVLMKQLKRPGELVSPGDCRTILNSCSHRHSVESPDCGVAAVGGPGSYRS